MARLTMREVADRAGVSVGTVSNALNRPDLVADETLRRVRQAIDDVGFVRNAAAAQLRGVQSPSLALLVLHIDPFFTAVARGVEAAASEVGHLVILCSSAEARTDEARYLRMLEEQRVAGILMTPVGRIPSKLSAKIRDRGTPIVLLDRRSMRKDQCSVSVDHIEGGRLAAQHLIALGHEHIGLINGPTEILQCSERRTGFLEALTGAGLGLAASCDLTMPEMTMAGGEEAIQRLLQQRKRPTAVFCTNDLLALGAERAMFAAGLRVPSDMAIVGYDDVPFAETALVPLSTVRQPAYELGYQATRLLLNEVNQAGHVHERITFRPELVARASTLHP